MTITDPKIIEEVLTRRVEAIYPSRKALKKVLLSGKRIRLYLGIDPTAYRLHLGHTVQLRKLQEFADLGHEAILLFGTGTVLVGDPSQRASARKLITEKEIEENIKTWKDQVKAIIDFAKVTIKYNGDWLTKLTLKELVWIGSKISAIQLFKRDNFTRRLNAGDTVWYHETMYPLLQGYDSVAMDVDLELGGTDQTFNMLIGRELQKKINNKEKFVLAGKMIVGTDGAAMSKTSGNCIWLTDTAEDMYGKIMKVQDALIPDYFEFFTIVPMTKVREIKIALAEGEVNPMDYKKQLALEITSQFHGEDKARVAAKEFKKVHQERETPTKMPQFPLEKLSVNPLNPIDLLVETQLCSSRSEAKRLIEQGAFKLNNQAIQQFSNVTIKPADIIKAGKRQWLKFI